MNGIDLPYYTLKQAATKLNNNFKTDIYDEKSLLAIALSFDIELHSFFQGWSFLWDIDVVFSTEFIQGLDSKTHNEYRIRVAKAIDSMTDLITTKGYLVKLSKTAIFTLQSKNFVEICEDRGNLPDEILQIGDCFEQATLNLPELINKTIVVNHFKGHELCSNVESIEVLQVYFSEDSDCGVERLIPSASSYELSEDDFYFYPKICMEHIVITKYQLDKIIKQNFIPLKQLFGEINSEIKTVSTHKRKRNGVSPDKLNAKLAAATLAEYLWRQDTDQKIKIKDMATTVLIELKQTSHIYQLPENPESLKKWIEEIAPPYARESGRPSEK